MKKNLMARLLAAALSLSMILALGACGNRNPSPAPAQSGAPAETSAPAETGAPTETDATAITLNLDGEPSSLSPVLMGGSKSANLMYNLCYASLWRVEHDDSLACDLAESYEVDYDNMVITAHLREGLKFADGSPLTAEDVVCSIKTSNADSGSNTGTIDVERTVALDDNTVQIGLKSTSFATMVDLSCIGIISKEWTEDGTNEEKKSADILCSGPYSIQPWSTGKDMVYDKNPNYWNADNVKYEQITVKCIGDETTRFLDYQNGNVDVCMLNKSENIDSVEAGLAPGTAEVYPMQSVMGLAFDTENIDDFENENLRLAIAYAIDVDTLVSAYCGTRYTVAKSVFPSTSPYFTDCAEDYDPDLAKEYLQKYYDETGATSATIKMTARKDTMEATLAEAVQYQLDQVLGVKVEVMSMDNASYFDAQAKGEQYSSIVPLARGFYDPAKYMNAWMATSSNSIMHMPTPELDALLMETITNTSLTPEERTEKLAQLQTDLCETGKFVPMFEEFGCYAVNNNVSTLENCLSGDCRLLQGLWLTELPAPLAQN